MAGIGSGSGDLQVPIPVEKRKRYVYVPHCPQENHNIQTMKLTIWYFLFWKGQKLLEIINKKVETWKPKYLIFWHFYLNTLANTFSNLNTILWIPANYLLIFYICSKTIVYIMSVQGPKLDCPLVIDPTGKNKPKFSSIETKL